MLKRSAPFSFLFNKITSLRRSNNQIEKPQTKQLKLLELHLAENHTAAEVCIGKRKKRNGTEQNEKKRSSNDKSYYYIFKVQNHNLIDLNISLSWKYTSRYEPYYPLVLLSHPLPVCICSPFLWLRRCLHAFFCWCVNGMNRYANSVLWRHCTVHSAHSYRYWTILWVNVTTFAAQIYIYAYVYVECRRLYRNVCMAATNSVLIAMKGIKIPRINRFLPCFI